MWMAACAVVRSLHRDHCRDNIAMFDKLLVVHWECIQSALLVPSGAPTPKVSRIISNLL